MCCDILYLGEATHVTVDILKENEEGNRKLADYLYTNYDVDLFNLL